jgi:eukaryotic-like serine/threonine-protein kinase
LHGDAERLAEDVLVDATIWKAAFDATSELLAYTSGGRLTRQGEWYDRSGKPLNVPGEKTPDALAVRLSPDEARLAVGGLFGDVWIHDLKRKVNTRLTFGPGPSFSPIWSPDGQWVAYDANRLANTTSIASVPTAQARKNCCWRAKDHSVWLLIGPQPVMLYCSVQEILFPAARSRVLPLLHDRKPTLLVKGSSFSTNARFSPDGHWVSYNSDESGRTEVYVVPFGGGAGRWQVSNSGGTQAIWRRDGKELFYVNADSMLVSLPVTYKAGRVEFGAVHPLFRVANPMNNVGLYDPYDVA